MARSGSFDQWSQGSHSSHGGIAGSRSEASSQGNPDCCQTRHGESRGGFQCNHLAVVVLFSLLQRSFEVAEVTGGATNLPGAIVWPLSINCGICCMLVELENVELELLTSIVGLL